MVFTDFAPLEGVDDAFVALRMLFAPWRWRRGKAQQKVKTKLKTFFPGHNCFLFLTARGALYQILQNLPLSRGDEILVQAFTCEAVILPILAQGFKPIYVDIEPQSYSMDPEDLRDKITPNSRVLILQHSFGILPKNRDRILRLVRGGKITVIEDVAHGFDREALHEDNEKTIKLLSFGRSKMLSSVWGGAVATSDKRLSEKLRSLEKRLAPPSFFFTASALCYKPLAVLIKATYSLFLGRVLHFFLRVSSPAGSEISQKEKEGNFDNLFNKSYPNALAALLFHQLKKFERIYELRAQNSIIYTRTISQKYPDQDLALGTTNHALLRYPFLVENPQTLIKKARKKGILLGRWYDQVIAPSVVKLDTMEYVQGSCPKAEEIAKKIVNLPTSVTPKQASKIVKLISSL